jgi:putative oxidoreductase
MKITVTVARILLGLLFLVAGASGFFLISNPPPSPPGLAGVFQDVFFKSRWVLFVDSVELIAGVLLLVNRYVPLALLLLASVLSNVLVFHLTMMPSGIVPGLVATVLWAIIALQYRSTFAPLFVQKARPDESAAPGPQTKTTLASSDR